MAQVTTLLTRAVSNAKSNYAGGLYEKGHLCFACYDFHGFCWVW